MQVNGTHGKAAGGAPAAGLAALFWTRLLAAAESSRSPTSAVATAGGDGALEAAVDFRRQLMRHRMRGLQGFELQGAKQPSITHTLVAGGLWPALTHPYKHGSRRDLWISSNTR